MEINALAINYLDGNPVCSDWKEFHQLLGKMQSHPSTHWNLAEMTCLAVGGNKEQALLAAAAIAGLHTSIVMIDDLLDNDERFDSMNLSQGDIANLSSAILAAGLNAVFQSGLDGAVQFQIVQQINQAVMATAAGQYWDTHSTPIHRGGLLAQCAIEKRAIFRRGLCCWRPGRRRAPAIGGGLQKPGRPVR